MKDVRKASDEYLGSLDGHEVAVQPDESTRDQFDDPDIVDLLGADFNPDDMIEDWDVLADYTSMKAQLYTYIYIYILHLCIFWLNKIFLYFKHTQIL